jgi:hypothetical protein
VDEVVGYLTNPFKIRIFVDESSLYKDPIRQLPVDNFIQNGAYYRSKVLEFLVGEASVFDVKRRHSRFTKYW